MNIAFAGFRHYHIFGLYDSVLKNSEVTLSGCFEEDEESKKSVEKSLGVKFNYNSYDEFLNDESIDAIAIGDYYGKRGQMVIAALKAGKHGGTINDIAIHGIDIVRFITGKNLTKVNCAKTWNAFATKEPDFKDCGQFMAEMEDISVMADVSYAAPKFDGIMPTYWDFYFWGTKGMLKFNLKSNNIHIFRTEEEIIECADRKIDYLKDFILEINGTKTIMNTLDILKSQRHVLEIQKAAE